MKITRTTKLIIYAFLSFPLLFYTTSFFETNEADKNNAVKLEKVVSKTTVDKSAGETKPTEDKTASETKPTENKSEGVEDKSEKIYTSLTDEYYDIIKPDSDYEALKKLEEQKVYDVEEIAKSFCTIKKEGLDEYSIILYLHKKVESSDMDDYVKRVVTKLIDYSIKLGKKYYCP